MNQQNDLALLHPSVATDTETMSGANPKCENGKVQNAHFHQFPK
jgi:hypothetical protein